MIPHLHGSSISASTMGENGKMPNRSRRSEPDASVPPRSDHRPHGACARAYDNLGQRTFFGTEGTVDCAVDLVGIPTDVATASNERWLGGSLRFEAALRATFRRLANMSHREACEWSG